MHETSDPKMYETFKLILGYIKIELFLTIFHISTSIFKHHYLILNVMALLCDK